MTLQKALLSTSYFGPIEYFAALDNANEVVIESCEQYQKQSYRTRCHILTGNGILVLTLPVLRGSNQDSQSHTHKLPVTDILVDYTKPWILQHKRAFEAAYGNSPFFEYYKDEIFEILDSHIPSLFEINKAITSHICSLCGIKTKISFSNDYVPAEMLPDNITDLRELIHPKIAHSNNPFYREEKYFQVFTQKFGFTPNLSILDLLFNEGPNAISFL